MCVQLNLFIQCNKKVIKAGNSPGRIFADVRPQGVTGGFGTVEVGQDVFHTVVMTSLVYYLFDETARDGHGTMGRIFVIPERKKRRKQKII